MNIKRTIKQLDTIPIPDKAKIIPGYVEQPQYVKTNNFRVLTVGMVSFMLIVGVIALALNGIDNGLITIPPLSGGQTTEPPALNQQNCGYYWCECTNSDCCGCIGECCKPVCRCDEKIPGQPLEAVTAPSCYNCFYGLPGGACLEPIQCAGVAEPPITCTELPCGCPCDCLPTELGMFSTICHRMLCVNCDELPLFVNCEVCGFADCEDCLPLECVLCGCMWNNCKRFPVETSRSDAILNTEFTEYSVNDNTIRYIVTFPKDYCGFTGYGFRLEEMLPMRISPPRWGEVPFASDIEWISIGIMVEPNESWSYDIDVQKYFGRLEPGRYRITANGAVSNEFTVN